MQSDLAELSSALRSSFRSVDVRVAVCENLPVRFLDMPERRPDAWEPLYSAIRISSRTPDAVQQRHQELTQTLGAHSSLRFKVLLGVIPVTELPLLTTGQTVVARVDRDRLVLEPRATNASILALVRRGRQFVMPWRDSTPRSAAEYFYAPSTEASNIHAYLAALDSEVSRQTGRVRTDLIRSYLELTPQGQGGTCVTYVEVEMPASIRAVEVIGKSLEMVIECDAPPENVRATAARRHMPTYTILGQRDLTLIDGGADRTSVSFRGRVEFEDLHERDRIECRLIDDRVGDIDELMGEARAFMRISEQNPLLACLRRFWNLDQRIYGPVEHPAKTKSGAADAFQAGIARMLTVCGFQAIDLERDDKLKLAGSKVEVGTADILAYSRVHRTLLVGACTINVPKDEDYEKLLHVTEVLRREWPENSRIIFIPVLFCGQQSDPVSRETLDRRGIRVLTHNDLVQCRERIESGRDDLVIESLVGAS